MSSSDFRSLIQQLQAADDTDRALKTKQVIIGLVNSFFSGFSKVSDTRVKERIETSLDFILQNALSQYPEIFIPSVFSDDSLATVKSKQETGKDDASGNDVNSGIKLKSGGNSNTNKFCSNEGSLNSKNSESKINTVKGELPYLFVADMQLDCQCRHFSRWVICRMLAVLSSLQLKFLKPKAKSVIITILQSSKINMPFYSELITELIFLLHDLMFSFRSFHEDLGIEFPPKLQRFWNVEIDGKPQTDSISSSSSELTNMRIFLPDSSSCQQLQIVVCELLSEIMLDAALFASNNVEISTWDELVKSHAENRSPRLLESGTFSSLDILWSIICDQLEFGEVDVKSSSIELAASLLQMNECGNSDVMKQIVDFLFSLLELLLSGFVDCDGDFNRLEIACATFLKILSDTQSFALDLCKGLTRVILSKGYIKIKTDDLIVALISSLSLSLNSSNDCDRTSDFSESSKQLCAYVLNELCCSTSKTNFTFCCPLLCALLQRDVKTAQVENLTSNVSPQTSKTKKLSSKRNHAEVRTCEEVNEINVRNVSSTAALMLERLDRLSDSLLKSKDINYNLVLLKAIGVILESFVLFTSVKHECYDLDSSHVTYNLLTNDDVTKLINSFVKFLSLHYSNASDRDGLIACYDVLVFCCNSFVSLVPAGLEGKVMVKLVGILSLPWLCTESSWLDLGVDEDMNSLGKVSECLIDDLRDETVCSCLSVMSRLKRRVAAQWRMRVLRICAAAKIEDVRAQAVRCIPVFMGVLGSNFKSVASDIVIELLRDSSDKVLVTLAETSGSLICSLFGRTTIKNLQYLSFESVVHSYSDQALRERYWLCDRRNVIVCGCSEESSHNVKSHVKEFEVVVPSVVLPLIKQLTSSSDSSVKIFLIQNFSKIFAHIHNTSAAEECLKCVVTLMDDADTNVQTTFSKFVCHLISPGTTATASRCNKILSKQFGRFSSNRPDSATMETRLVVILCSAGEICKTAEDELMLSALVLVLNSIFFPMSSLLEFLARDWLIKVAEFRQVTMTRLFIHFDSEICKAFVECLHETKQSKPDWDQIPVLEKITEVFEFTDVQAFLKSNEKFLLPHLMLKATPTSSTLLRCFAQQMSDPNHKNPIVRTIVPVFCHVICSCPTSGGELERVLKYLETETGWTLDQILRMGDNTDSRLMIHIGEHREQVLNGLRIWLAACGTTVGSQDSDLADRLQSNILGTLVHFDRYLSDTSVRIVDKRKAFASLIKFVELMGRKHITKVRMRVMSTLRIGRRFKDDDEFVDLSCEAWSVFVRILDPSSLGPMLSQMVEALLLLLAARPGKVAAIMKYLIVDNEKVFAPYFHELHFVPESPDLSVVLSVLKKYASDDATDVRKEVARLMSGVTHEAPEVRQRALEKLGRWLRCNRLTVQGLILRGSDTAADPLVSELVGALLKGCLEADASSRPLYGECLGELGAVDPGRLALSSNRPHEDLKNFTASIMHHDFVFKLINELTKAFIRADDRIKDSVAYSLQMLIQMFCLNPVEQAGGSQARTTSPLWERFTPEVQELLSPFIHSRYLQNLQYNWSGIVLPVFSSKKGETFEQWIRTFCCYVGSRVEEERCSKIYQSCCGVMRQDSQVSLFFLPFLIVQVLIEGDPTDVEMIFNEMCAVLNKVQEPDSQSVSLSDRNHLIAQTIFSVLDHVTKYLRYRFLLLSTKPSQDKRHLSAVDIAKADPNYSALTQFMSRVPQDALSRASYNCGAYARALMYHEFYMRRSMESSDSWGDERLKGIFCSNDRSHLDTLLNLYVALDEPDCVAGVVAAQRTQPSLSQQIAALESVGKLSDAAVCYDHAMRLSPDDFSLCRGRLRNCLALGELTTVHQLASGLIAEKPSWQNDLNTYRIEATWKLSQWDKLSDYITGSKPSSSSAASSSAASSHVLQDWNVSIGSLLLSIKNRDEELFSSRLTMARRELIGPLSAACMESGSYQRGYEYIVRLHMLAELEEFASLIYKFDLPSVGTNSFSATNSEIKDIDLTGLMSQWNERLELSQFSYRTRAPVLDLRRTMLQLAYEDSPQDSSISRLIGRCWLASARVALECGLIQTAHSSLLSAAGYDLPDHSLEKAHWLWAKGDTEAARLCLEHEIETTYPDRIRIKESAGTQSSTLGSSSSGSGAVGSWSEERRLMCARIMLQLACYSEETASCESNAIIRQFRAVKDVYPEWEDGHYRTAMYFDKIMTALAEGEYSDRRGDFVLQVVNYFGQSLLYGSQFIYQSMPRMLTLWLDYGAEVSTIPDSRPETVKQSMRNSLSQLNKLMSNFSSRLAPFQFLVAFPQLISRICHTHPDVFLQLLDIIATLLREFPQQSIWMMMAVSKSSYQMRAKRCQEIFSRAKSLSPDLHKFLSDATRLTDQLLILCNKPVEGAISANMLRISLHFKALQRLLDDPAFSPILLPLQSQMEPLLPSSLVFPAKHNAFPSVQIYIQGIEDAVDVLASLQRPKKIQFRGTDGKTYPMLCKPKDDLRKDGRLMEFTGVVNRCLKRDPDSRRRDLHIRTFAVTPLNEECGMLEWVPNTTGLRPILLKMYKERGLHITGKELCSLQLPANAPRDKKLVIYKEKLLPRHPAIFSEWFLKTFPDPTAWYGARLVYCRSAAVMSMVGYILGLGDRHGENILLDSMTGDCVHVDFNCLFNKGETFDYPEIVPFRLTHNMVEAMGPLGHEGVFRRSCEVTLRVMRDQTDPLMSVLKTFIFDPLVEWSKPSRGRGNAATESGEIRNEKAQTHVNNIEDRLRGIMKVKAKPKGLPLSVEGHVSYLIQEATDINNLCQMYIGWAAYM